jgi:hypothetical protein
MRAHLGFLWCRPWIVKEDKRDWTFDEMGTFADRFNAVVDVCLVRPSRGS